MLVPEERALLVEDDSGKPYDLRTGGYPKRPTAIAAADWIGIERKLEAQWE